MKEKPFENKVKAYLDKLPKCWYFKVWGGGFQKAGIPDIIGVNRGKFFALEIKGDGGKPSALQERNIELINKCGGIGMFVYPSDFEKLKEVIN